MINNKIDIKRTNWLEQYRCFIVCVYFARDNLAEYIK